MRGARLFLWIVGPRVIPATICYVRSLKIKEELGDRLEARAAELGVPDLLDKIADERSVTTVDELMERMREAIELYLDVEEVEVGREFIGVQFLEVPSHEP